MPLGKVRHESTKSENVIHSCLFNHPSWRTRGNNAVSKLTSRRRPKRTASGSPPATKHRYRVYGLMGDAPMAMPSQYDANHSEGSNIDIASGQEPSFAAQLRKTLNTIPAYTWYALPSGVLTFVNEGYANYLGLAQNDPLRHGVEIDVPWDTHIELVHPDDHEATISVGEACKRTGTAGQAAFRIRHSEGEYRWSKCAGGR